MPKVDKDKKRLRFYSSKREQTLIESIRQYGGHEEISGVVTRALDKELELIERKMNYLKQDMEAGKAGASEEYKKYSILHGPIEVLCLNWKELLREITGKN